MYNISNITATNTTLEFMQKVNTELSGGLLGNGWSVVIFIISLSLAIYLIKDFRKALIFAGGINFLLSGLLFLAAGFVGWYLPILYLALTIIGIVMLQHKDYGP